MIFDVTDPIGAIQTVFSILILVELIQFLDKDDMGAHIQERIAFYSGIIGKVGDGLGKMGAGMQKILGLFSKKEKDQEEEKREKLKQAHLLTLVVIGFALMLGALAIALLAI